MTKTLLLIKIPEADVTVKENLVKISGDIKLIVTYSSLAPCTSFEPICAWIIFVIF